MPKKREGIGAPYVKEYTKEVMEPHKPIKGLKIPKAKEVNVKVISSPQDSAEDWMKKP